MREIAIRIWSHSKKQWISPVPTIAGDLPISFSFSTDKNPITYIGFNKNFLGFEDYEIVRYTGLTDKNGVKIFEGDILKGPTPWDSYEDKVNIVKYEDGRWNYSYSLDEYTDDPEKNWEVIGNIYENSELLG